MERRKPKLVNPRATGAFRPYGGARKLFVAPDIDEKSDWGKDLIKRGMSYICGHEILIEGPAGTGKTYAVQQLVYDLVRKYPGIRVLFTRESRSAMSETVLKTWEIDVLGPRHPAFVGGATRATRKCYYFANRSEVHAIGMSNVDSVMSGEYDLIVYFEVVDEQSESVWAKLQSRLRNQRIPHPRGYADKRGTLLPKAYEMKLKRPIPRSIDSIWELKRRGWFKQGAPLAGARWPDGQDIFWHLSIADCNPGPPHHWANKRADKKRKDGSAMMTRILSRHGDNPTCTATYLETLDALPAEERDRLFLGLWRAAEGAVYADFDPDVHCVKFDPNWKFSHYVGGIDWGYDAAGVFQVWGISPAGMFRVEEVYFKSKQQEWWQQVIVDAAEKYNMPIIVADPSNPSAIDSMNARLSHSRANTRIKKADNAILPGIDAVRYGLKPGMGMPPKIYLVQDGFPIGLDAMLGDSNKGYPQCTEQEIPSYVWEDWTPGKPLKERPKTGQHDHGCDTMRYVAVEVMRPGYLQEDEVAGNFEVHSWTQDYIKERLKRGKRRKPTQADAEIFKY